jgi:hypothetical protein
VVRPPGPGFTQEVGLISSLCRPIAQALRRTLLVDASRRATEQGAAEQGAGIPGLVVVGCQGAVETITAPAHHWLTLLGEPVATADEEWLPPAVHSVVAAVRRAARAGGCPTARLVAPSVSGGVGRAPRCHGRGRIARTGGSHPPWRHRRPHRPMTLAAAGLTTREQEVVALVIEGLPTKLIARRLSLSVYTVQDPPEGGVRQTGSAQQAGAGRAGFLPRYSPVPLPRRTAPFRRSDPVTLGPSQVAARFRSRRRSGPSPRSGCVPLGRADEQAASIRSRARRSPAGPRERRRRRAAGR